MFLLLLQFAFLALVIIVAGTLLTRWTGQLADSTGLEQSLAGLLLLATATSLPELAVNLRAAFVPAVDLAVGSTLGSSLFNLMILALLDLGRRPWGQMLSPVAAAHSLSATSSIVLTSLAALFIALPVDLQWGGVGLGPIAIVLGYLLFVRLIFFDQQFAAQEDAATTGEYPIAQQTPRRAVLVRRYLSAAGVVFVAAVALVPTADELATRSGLGRSFIGTTLVALASSMPEIVTTYTAIRMGSVALAVGNIFGSNAFNMVTLLPIDVFYRQGSLLADCESVHLITALCVVMVTSVAMAGLLYRPNKRYWIIEPDAIGVLLLILASLCLIYKLS